MSSPPADTGSTRGRHFGELMHRRAVAYGIAFGLLAVVVAAIALDNVVVLAGAPVVVGVIVVIAFARASQLAETDFFTAFAAAHGFSYSPRFDMVPYTPLLGAGDRRHCVNYMNGPLAPGGGLSCALSQYTFEVRNETTDSDGTTTTTWDPHHFTFCCADLGAMLPQLGGIYLAEHRGLLSKFGEDNWLRGRRLRKTELESSDFHERYDLLIEPDQDEIALRQLFSPSLIEWFAAHPLRPCFEYQAGVLVVYVEHHLDDDGHLQWLLEATRELVSRFDATDVSAAA